MMYSSLIAAGMSKHTPAIIQLKSIANFHRRSSNIYQWDDWKKMKEKTGLIANHPRPVNIVTEEKYRAK